MEHDTNINIQNNIGILPLFEAYRNRDKVIIKNLIKHGANVNKDN